MTNPDDKHDDHELAAWLDGRDGVSAAYRQTADEEPPPALDRTILQAARSAVEQPAASRDTAQPPALASRYSIRKPYALAASVMIAVAGLSLYIGVRDDVALQPGAAIERVIELEAPLSPQPDAASPQDSAQDALPAAEAQRRVQAEAQSARAAADAEASDAERSAASNFEQRQLAPAVPAAGAGATGASIPPPAAAQRREALARREEAAVIVIDGPLLQQIEAEAEAAQASRANAEAGEITVTGSRILRPETGRPSPAYRASRDEWLAALRTLVAEIERSTRLAVARRNTAVLERQLEDEIALFLQSYPDTDVDAELGLE